MIIIKISIGILGVISFLAVWAYLCYVGALIKLTVYEKKGILKIKDFFSDKNLAQKIDSNEVHAFYFLVIPFAIIHGILFLIYYPIKKISLFIWNLIPKDLIEKIHLLLIKFSNIELINREKNA